MDSDGVRNDLPDLSGSAGSKAKREAFVIATSATTAYHAARIERAGLELLEEPSVAASVAAILTGE